MSANVYDTLSEKQRKEIQEAIDSFKEGAFDIHNYIRSFEPTNELPIGIYDIPKDCRAVVLEGGRSIEIRKKKNLPLEPTEHRCCHCKHYVEGHTGLYHWSTMVCNAKPKVLSKAMEKRKAESKWYKDYTLYYAAQRYGKPCEMFELKEERKMKAEELMIGDKIVAKRIECVGDGGQYQEWKEFGEIIRILEDTVYVMFDKQKDDWEEIDIKDIEPIPLTVEILEKNGFERRDDLIGDDNFLPFIFERLDTDECFEIIIYWRDSYCNGAADAFNEVTWDEYWKLHILSSPSLYEYETENCIYVHELQHALKLCKIQKEIVL